MLYHHPEEESTKKHLATGTSQHNQGTSLAEREPARRVSFSADQSFNYAEDVASLSSSFSIERRCVAAGQGSFARQ